MHHPVLSAASSALLGFCSLTIGQIPTQTEFGEWSKLGFSGACLALAILLVTNTIPSILKSQRETNDAIREEITKGFGDVKKSIDTGNDRVATLLQSTLVQAFREHQDGK